MVVVEATTDTSSKDPVTTSRPPNGDQYQAESPSQLDIPDDPPPPYTPPASRQGSGSPTTIPPPPRTSHGPPKRPPRCTCPRAGDADQPGGVATNTDPPEGTAGTNWGTKLKGAALVAIAAPTLAVAGAAIALPVLGFASTGVVGGSIAAAVQSAVYGGATGGLFSVMQSVGATIVAPSLISTVTAGGAATLGLNMIAGGDQNPDEGGEGGDGHDDDGEDGAEILCSCVACVCDANCECACRRQQRGK